MTDDVPDNEVNMNNGIDNEVAELVIQLSDNVHSYSSKISSSKLIITSTASASSSAVVTTPTRHDKIHEVATDHYLATANKKMKLHQDSLNIIVNNFHINDCVGIEIHSVDRTDTDPKYLPCRIIEKTEKNNTFLYKLLYEYGVLQNTLDVGQFMNLNDAYPNELKQIDAGKLKPITLIEASKLYDRGCVTDRTCN